MVSLIYIFLIYYIVYLLVKSANAKNLEMILKHRNFKMIHRVSGYRNYGRVYITATSNAMQYLFVRNGSDAPIKFMSHEELKSIQEFSRKLNCDRVIVYVNEASIPIELTKMAALYNIEIWNKYGDSNFESYRTTKINTNTSNLARTLKPNNAVFEHKQNGVIAQDTCHIAPTVSPIKENPTGFFKKKGPQRL